MFFEVLRYLFNCILKLILNSLLFLIEIGGFFIKFCFNILSKLLSGFSWLICIRVFWFIEFSNVLMFGILEMECLSWIKFFVLIFL